MRSHTSAVSSHVDPGTTAAREALHLRGRIRAEYVEMPGLTLTLMQAARLFGVEPPACSQALNALVQDGFLALRGRSYLRAR
jgi:hypothetical protein